jgi:hypothetical protein
MPLAGVLVVVSALLGCCHARMLLADQCKGVVWGYETCYAASEELRTLQYTTRTSPNL